MRQSRFTVVTLSALCAAVSLIGCSPVAWAPRETPHTSSIDLGEQVTLKLRDGSTVGGTYEAIQELSDAEYDQYYTSRLHGNADGAALPAIGQRVSYTTSLDEKRIWTGQLVGFDESHLLLAVPGHSAPEKIYFSSLGTITGKEGRPIRRMSLRGMFLNGEIPLKSAVIIRGAAEKRHIPLNEIEKISISPPTVAGTAVAWLDPGAVSWARN